MVRERLEARANSFRADRAERAIEIEVSAEGAGDPLIDADTTAHVVAIVSEAGGLAGQPDRPMGSHCVSSYCFSLNRASLRKSREAPVKSTCT